MTNVQVDFFLLDISEVFGLVRQTQSGGPKNPTNFLNPFIYYFYLAKLDIFLLGI